MAFATNRMYEEQERLRKENEMYQALHAGKIVAVPSTSYRASIMDGATPTNAPIHDEIRYNYNSMTYETRSQTIKIQELERQIGQEQLKKVVAEEDEKTKLKNLIAYYYNR